MDGNKANKVPLLDCLIDAPAKDISGSSTSNEPNINAVANSTSSNKVEPVEVQSEIENTNPAAAPRDSRKTSKSQFEIELTQIVNRILANHIEIASEEITKKVLFEVRSRLPGQRKS